MPLWQDSEDALFGGKEYEWIRMMIRILINNENDNSKSDIMSRRRDHEDALPRDRYHS